MEEKTLVPVHKGDIELGRPLPFSAFDAHGRLLLKQGQVVEFEHQLNILISKGLFREGTQRSPLPQVTDGYYVAPEGKGLKNSQEFSAELQKLMPGDTLNLQPANEKSDLRWRVQVIGHVKGKCLMTTTPSIDGKLAFVEEGETFLLRFFSGNHACAFRSKLYKAPLQPFPYLVFAWPTGIQARAVREFVRAPIQLPVVVSKQTTGEAIGSGEIRDISMGGAKLHLDGQGCYIGQPVSLSFKFELDGIEDDVLIPATVLSVTQEEGGAGQRLPTVYGLKFEQLNLVSRLVIWNLVSRYLLSKH